MLTMQLEIVAQFSWEIRLILNGFVKFVKSGLLLRISGQTNRDTCGGDCLKSYGVVLDLLGCNDS